MKKKESKTEGPPQRSTTRAPVPTNPLGLGAGYEAPSSPFKKQEPEGHERLPKKTPKLPRRINGDDLMKRWDKQDFELIAYWKELDLNIYYPSGELIPKNRTYPIIIESVIFDLSEVEEFEKKYPVLLKEKTAKRSTEQEKAIFPCVSVTEWEDITITLKADDMVRIKTPQGEGLS